MQYKSKGSGSIDSSSDRNSFHGDGRESLALYLESVGILELLWSQIRQQIPMHEEMTFDDSGITVDGWTSYPILTMADIPEIKIVLLNNPNVGKYGGGSEAANALVAPAIAAALHDATGKVVRRLPLKPAYVQANLKA